MPKVAAPIREKIIKIRVSGDEYEALKQRSTRAGLGRWMREFCLADDVKPKRSTSAPTASPELLRGLRGIGNNVNQIARQVNTSGVSAMDRVELLAALVAVERALLAVANDR